MVDMDKMEGKMKLILEKTTPQAFLLWLFYALTRMQTVVLFGFELDENLVGFIVLIAIGLAFSSIIKKLKDTENELSACQKANLTMRYKYGIPIDGEDEPITKPLGKKEVPVVAMPVVPKVEPTPVPVVEPAPDVIPETQE